MCVRGREKEKERERALLLQSDAVPVNIQMYMWIHLLMLPCQLLYRKLDFTCAGKTVLFYDGKNWSLLNNLMEGIVCVLELVHAHSLLQKQLVSK